jgi:hypothetical protein
MSAGAGAAMATVAMVRMEAIVVNCILNGVDWKESGLGEYLKC